MRLSALVLGIFILIWLPFEDTNENIVVVIATAICVWFAVRYLLSPAPLHQSPWFRHLYAGVVAGLSITPVALLLMVFKLGLHGHETPDFSPFQMARIVELTPLWGTAGLLIGIGTGWWRAARTK